MIYLLQIWVIIYVIYLLQKTALDPTEDVFNGGIRSLSLSLLTEGSYSDSGISDEGSEQELSEREHRLAAIRRLVRQLEAIMAPDSDARIKMTKVRVKSHNIVDSAMSRMSRAYRFSGGR